MLRNLSSTGSSGLVAPFVWPFLPVLSAVSALTFLLRGDLNFVLLGMPSVFCALVPFPFIVVLQWVDP